MNQLTLKQAALLLARFFGLYLLFYAAIDMLRMVPCRMVTIKSFQNRPASGRLWNTRRNDDEESGNVRIAAK